jgi:hypothetical protein
LQPATADAIMSGPQLLFLLVAVLIVWAYYNRRNGSA